MKKEQAHPEKQFIDIKDVFYRKNPGMAQLIPGFVYRYLKRILHQDEINEIIYENQDYSGLDYIGNILNRFGIKTQVSGYENIPDEGRFIFVANHPLGGIDGLAFAKAVGSKFRNIKFIVNDILMNLENLNTVFVPVNKHGKQTSDYVRQIDAIYQSDAQILNFPAGLCSRKNRQGRIVDREWYKSFIVKAKKHKRDIIPVHIYGRNSNFFYNLANLREMIGIKANLEMFYLPDEMFRQKNKKIYLRFGRPIPYRHFTNRKKPQEWAFDVKKRVYELGQEPIA